MASTIQSSDEHWMRLAVQLAARGQGHVEPNPMVGCVIVKDQKRLGQGYHRRFGGAHAEVDALGSLESAADASGATAYVTLEPCCHHGKTPPCSDALIDAKVGRVVVAMRDPFPQVDGGGIDKLRDAGIRVDVGVLRQDAESLNAPYLKRLRSGKPWTIAKWAMTIDGRIATTTGQSQWISGDASRADVHQLRGRVDAIITGMGTVQADDPMLNARPRPSTRLTDGPPSPDAAHEDVTPPRVATRIVLCRTRLPRLDSQLIRTAEAIPTWLFLSSRVQRDAAARQHVEQLTGAGAVVIPLDAGDDHDMIHQMLVHLGDRSMTNVMIEAGPGLLGSFLGGPNVRGGHSVLGGHSDSCEIDECRVYVGAKLFGGATAPGPVAGSGIRICNKHRNSDCKPLIALTRTFA